jgi:integrase
MIQLELPTAIEPDTRPPMTLTELLTTLVDQGALAAKYATNTKSSLNYLARALDYPGADQCPADAIGLGGQAALDALEAYFAALSKQGKTTSAKVRSNARNTIRVVIRRAMEQGLIAEALPLPALVKPQLRETCKAQLQETNPYRSSYYPTTGPPSYGLHPRDWPPDCLAGWERYVDTCDDKLRPTRLQTNVDHLRLYFGYIRNILGRQPLWEDVFTKAHLRGFVRWNAARVERQPLSSVGWQVVIVAATIAKVLGRPEAKELATYRNDLGTPDEVRDKENHWLSLAELRAVADAWLEEGRKPVPKDRRDRHHGARLATRFQKGVILMLLTHIPLRRRNIHELRFPRNLFQDRSGHWTLRFRGGDLKIGRQGGRKGTVENVYGPVDLTTHCPDLVALLDEWRDTYRPRLPGAAESPYLFLTHTGRPFTGNALYVELKMAVKLKTGKRWNPHMIRTTWPTEFLLHPDHYGDFLTAAVMLGDTVETVIKHYSHLFKGVHHGKAAAFNASVLHAG